MWGWGGERRLGLSAECGDAGKGGVGQRGLACIVCAADLRLCCVCRNVYRDGGEGPRQVLRLGLQWGIRGFSVMSF